jgi:hypothetical protein
VGLSSISSIIAEDSLIPTVIAYGYLANRGPAADETSEKPTKVAPRFRICFSNSDAVIFIISFLKINNFKPLNNQLGSGWL